MAHVAARTDASMAANVMAFSSLSPFTVTRQVVGGAVIEEMVLDARPAVFTVAGHAVEAQPAPTPGAGTVVPNPARRWPRPTWSPGWCRRRARHTDMSGGPEVGPGRRRRRPRRRQRRRVRRTSSSSLSCSTASWCLPGGHQPWLAPAPRAGRPDRQPDLARDLPRLRHLRRHPALGRLLDCEDDPGDQHRRRGTPWSSKAHFAVIGDLHEIVPAINQRDPPASWLTRWWSTPLMALSAFRPLLHRHRPLLLPHGGPDARGEALRRAARTRPACWTGSHACAPSCSARSAPPATATASPKAVVLGLEGEDPATADTELADVAARPAPRRAAVAARPARTRSPFDLDEDLVLHRRRACPRTPTACASRPTTRPARRCSSRPTTRSAAASSSTRRPTGADRVVARRHPGDVPVQHRRRAARASAPARACRSAT